MKTISKQQKKLAYNIRKRRKEMGWRTVKSFADSIKVSESYLGDIERGFKLPNVFRLHQIARALETSLEWLIENNLK